MTEPWFIKDTEFRSRMSAEDLQTFLRVCPKKEHERGRILFHAGDPATHLHVIAEGQIKLVLPTSEGKERILAICGPDDFIGEAFLKTAGEYRVDAVTMTPAVTCPMSREQFTRITEETASFALSFAEILADHLLHCRNLLGSSYDSVRTRVIKTLLTQAQHFGTPTPRDGWLELPLKLTHEEIAAMVGATRVAVSTVFSELRNDDLVEGGRGLYQLNSIGLERALESS